MWFALALTRGTVLTAIAGFAAVEVDSLGGRILKALNKKRFFRFRGGDKVSESIGLAAAWFLGRAVEAILFGIKAADPVSTVWAVLVLVAAALLAAWIPARRAAKVDPMQALRWD